MYAHVSPFCFLLFHPPVRYISTTFVSLASFLSRKKDLKASSDLVSAAEGVVSSGGWLRGWLFVTRNEAQVRVAGEKHSKASSDLVVSARGGHQV